MVKTKKAIWLLIFASLIMALAGCATTQKSSDQAKKDWKFHTIVDVKFVQQYAKLPRPENSSRSRSGPGPPSRLRPFGPRSGRRRLCPPAAGGTQRLLRRSQPEASAQPQMASPQPVQGFHPESHPTPTPGTLGRCHLFPLFFPLYVHLCSQP